MISVNLELPFSKIASESQRFYIDRETIISGLPGPSSVGGALPPADGSLTPDSGLKRISDDVGTLHLGSCAMIPSGTLVKHISAPTSYKYICEAVYRVAGGISTCMYLTHIGPLDHKTGVSTPAVEKLTYSDRPPYRAIGLPIQSLLDPTEFGVRSEVDSKDFNIVPPIYDVRALDSFLTGHHYMQHRKPYSHNFNPIRGDMPHIYRSAVHGEFQEDVRGWRYSYGDDPFLGFDTRCLYQTVVENTKHATIVYNEDLFDEPAIDSVRGLRESFHVTVDMDNCRYRLPQSHELNLVDYLDPYRLIFGTTPGRDRNIANRICSILHKAAKSYYCFLIRRGYFENWPVARPVTMTLMKNHLEEFVIVVDDQRVGETFVFYTAVPILMLTTWAVESVLGKGS
jgi:hypothetical protein